jgi:hypothetical protein
LMRTSIKITSNEYLPAFRSAATRVTVSFAPPVDNSALIPNFFEKSPIWADTDVTVRHRQRLQAPLLLSERQPLVLTIPLQTYLSKLRTPYH